MRRTTLLLAMLLVGAVVHAAEPSAAPAAAEPAPAVAAALAPGWYARIDTSMGSILVRLLPEQAPQSVAHFAALAQGRLGWFDAVAGQTRHEPYYDGSTVHLASAGQRFEAGDRSGTGRGAPALAVPPETGPVGFSQAGRMGTTRSRTGGLSGVQFFITAVGTPWLNGAHNCFGEVVSGLDVVRAISTVKTYSNGRPIDPVTIERVQILSAGEPAALPEPIPYHAEQKTLQRRTDPQRP